MPKKWVALSALGIIFVAATGCQADGWVDTGAQAQCAHPYRYAITPGQFTAAQEGDIHNAAWVISQYSGVQVEFAGYKTVNAPKYSTWPDAYVRVQTINDTRTWSNSPMAVEWGGIWVGTYVYQLPAGIPAQLNQGGTFFAFMDHEFAHTLTGIGDAYTAENPHPELLMGTGPNYFSLPAAGDAAGLKAKGCAPK